MNNYKIILNEDRLKEFIDWLPELGPNEQFYLSLFARKKYSPELIHSNDRTQLKRFTSIKERIFDKIAQLEIPMGRWKLKDIAAPQESLVLYIHPNPRDMKKATRIMGKKCWDLEQNNHYNLVAESMSCIQQSIGTKYWIDFDIDDKEADLSLVKTILPDNTYRVLQTKGGYHVLVNTKSIKAFFSLMPEEALDYPKNWYLKLQETFNCDNIGDQMIPVPGCVQGEFEPKFIEI